jgi:hypothetical protein
MLSVVMLSVYMLSVVRLNVNLPNVVAHGLSSRLTPSLSQTPSRILKQIWKNF